MRAASDVLRTCINDTLACYAAMRLSPPITVSGELCKAVPVDVADDIARILKENATIMADLMTTLLKYGL